MKFLIQVVNEHNEEFYKNHSAMYKGDSGLDLFFVTDQTFKAGETKLVDLGIKSQLRSFEWCIWKWFVNKSVWRYHSYLLFPRSSIFKTPLRVANSIGLIDSAYLGHIKVALHNTSDADYTIYRGDRLVQLVRADLGEIKMAMVDELRSTERSAGGFGSSGR
jgi:dUTP pyrophosphatase